MRSTIYTQCFTFPEKLIFFLTAEFESQYLGTTYSLPKFETYAIVSCQGSGDPGNHSSLSALNPGDPDKQLLSLGSDPPFLLEQSLTQQDSL